MDKVSTIVEVNLLNLGTFYFLLKVVDNSIIRSLRIKQHELINPDDILKSQFILSITS